MDKVRIVLEYARKYHFWLLCAVAVIAGLVGWMMARGSLSQEYTKRKGTIDGKFTALAQIRNTEFPPNDTWQQRVTSLTDEERELVRKAWETVYDEQQKVLEWPDVLGENFKIEVMRWVDRRFTQKQQDAEMSETWRINYRNEVANVEFRKLLEIVDAESELEEDAKAGAPAPDPAAGRAEPPKVEWNADSQQKVQRAMVIDGMTVPSSFEVWLRLEDLWVYRALLKIIAATNADSGFISRVKKIEDLTIGVDAAQEFQKGMQPGGHIVYAEQPPAAQDQAVAPPPSGPDEVEKPLDEGRYVDGNGDPLAGGVGHDEQFKRMPIYLKLVMDQREITRLLTACANSPLPVEVKQLRINPDEDTKKGNREQQDQASEGPPKPTTLGIYDVTVEIHGLIYIYNPPDPAKLGQPGAGSGGV